MTKGLIWGEKQKEGLYRVNSFNSILFIQLMSLTDFMTRTRKTAGLSRDTIDSYATGRIEDFSVRETI